MHIQAEQTQVGVIETIKIRAVWEVITIIVEDILHIYIKMVCVHIHQAHLQTRRKVQAVQKKIQEASQYQAKQQILIRLLQ